MRTRQVRWFEGMLMLPHHFQANRANLDDVQATVHEWLNPNGYGLRSLSLNVDALANYEVRIDRLQARLKDGLLISVPENAHLETLDVGPLFKGAAGLAELYVYLLLPDVVSGRRNAARRGESETETRFLIETETWEERERGDNRREIETLYYNAKLQAQEKLDSPGGYEALPLCKLRRSQQAGAIPELDSSYIPPLLSCAGWPGLQQGILMTICSQLGSYIQTQAEALETQGGWAESSLPQIHRSIMQLNAANSSHPLLLQLFESQDLHPFKAYTELCRLVGQLAIVRNDWKPPALPMYDHDDLGGIFAAIQREIQEIFRAGGATSRVMRFPFVGTSNWMEVSLDRDWFDPGYEFYIGIRSELPPEKLASLFSHSHLDWKLGSIRSIQEIYKNAESGLLLRPESRGVASLPQIKDMIYFHIESSGPYWRQLVETPTLALMVNRRFVQGDFIGKNGIAVLDKDDRPSTLLIDLFVVENA